MVHRTIRELSTLASVMAAFGCAAGLTPTSVDGDRSAPSAEPAPAIAIAPEPPQAASVEPSTPEALVVADPVVEVGEACGGADLRLSALRDAGQCVVSLKAEKLSHDVTKRLQLVRTPLTVAAGARLDFVAQLKNLSAKAVVVDVRVGSGFSSLSSHKLTRAGSLVTSGKCSVSYLTSSEWYRVEIPAGASLALDGRFFANDGRIDPSQVTCRPAPLAAGKYELEVSVTVNGQELAESFELQVR